MFFPQYYGYPIRSSLNIWQEYHPSIFILINQFLNLPFQRIPEASIYVPHIVTIILKNIAEIIQLFIKMVIINNSHNSSGQGFQDTDFLGRYMLRARMEIFVSMCPLLVYLVCTRAIILSHDKDIQKGKQIILLSFHCEFDVIRLAIEVG